MLVFERAIFAAYEELSEIIQNWAAGYFPSCVTASAGQIEGAWVIRLTGLRPEDRACHRAVFAKYDREGRHDPDQE